MAGRIVLAVSDPLLRRAAMAELIDGFELAPAFDYAHGLWLLASGIDAAGLVVQNRSREGLRSADLLAEARRRRPDVGRTVIVPLMLRDGAVHDAGAHAICWAPWEVGQLLTAVRRAQAAARAAQASFGSAAAVR